MSERYKEIKVRIPVETHLRLTTLKLVKGTPIAQAVQEALQRYLSTLEEELRQHPALYHTRSELAADLKPADEARP
jgi:predicted DNA-binding protein